MTDVGIVLLVALGQNLVILAGEIDVSVGSILALSAVSAGFVAHETGALLVPLLIALGVGAGCGIVNGLLVTRFCACRRSSSPSGVCSPTAASR